METKTILEYFLKNLNTLQNVTPEEVDWHINEKLLIKYCELHH